MATMTDRQYKAISQLEDEVKILGKNGKVGITVPSVFYLPIIYVNRTGEIEAVWIEPN